MKRVAAVVVTYNRCEMLRQCLPALLAQTIACEILVVDNASTDDTAVYLQSIDEPRVRVMRLPENTGGAGGFYAGMKAAVEAGFDAVWIMDDDCIASETALEKLLEADVHLEGRYGWLSSRCVWTDGSDCPMNVPRITPYKDLKAFTEELDRVVMASFVSLFVRSETILQYGLPIKEFFIWSDDWEYTRRISRHEPCYAVPGSIAVHAMKNCTVVNIATDTQQRLPRYRYFYRNDVYLYRREGVKGYFWLVFKDIWHSIQVLVRSKEARMKKLGVIWGGFIRGLRFRPAIEYCAKTEVHR